MIVFTLFLVSSIAVGANAQREFVYPEENGKFADSLSTQNDRLDLGGFGEVFKFGVSVVAVLYLAVTVILPFLGINLLTAGKKKFRALTDDSSFVGNVITSIDPVEATFRFLDIEDDECRKREVCRFHKSISDDSTFTSILGSISSKLESLTKYRDAVKAGTEGLRCDELFNCPADKKSSRVNHRSRVLLH